MNDDLELFEQFVQSEWQLRNWWHAAGAMFGAGVWCKDTIVREDAQFLGEIAHILNRMEYDQ